MLNSESLVVIQNVSRVVENSYSPKLNNTILGVFTQSFN